MRKLQALNSQQFRALADFRYQIRRFLAFSELAAKEQGVEPHQHQLMLAVKGAPAGQCTVGFVAERLQIRHHSAVELVDRMEERSLVLRTPSDQDKRQVVVSLTRTGEAVVAALSAEHLSELSQTGPALIAALQEVLA